MPKLVLHTKMDWNIVVRKHFFQGPGLAYRQVTLYLTISVDLWLDKRSGPYEGNYCSFGIEHSYSNPFYKSQNVMSDTKQNGFLP
jgi:hypothetical protein